MKITNKNRVGKLENTIVRKGYSKVLRIRTLKDLIQYYDDDTGEFRREGEEETEVEFCLEPGLRKWIDDITSKDGDDDDDDESETESNKERNSC